MRHKWFSSAISLYMRLDPSIVELGCSGLHFAPPEILYLKCQEKRSLQILNNALKCLLFVSLMLYIIQKKKCYNIQTNE